MDLDDDFFLTAHKHGARWLFGVHLCSDGRMLNDEHEPYTGYFDAWLAFFDARLVADTLAFVNHYGERPRGFDGEDEPTPDGVR